MMGGGREGEGEGHTCGVGHTFGSIRKEGALDLRLIRRQIRNGFRAGMIGERPAILIKKTVDVCTILSNVNFIKKNTTWNI
jgi:hypothetical protein